MYRDLTAWIECGEIDNSQINMVFGYLCIKGLARPIRLHLTGTTSERLRGKRHRFCVAKIKRRRVAATVQSPKLDVQQIGPVIEVQYDTDGFQLIWSGQNGPLKISIPAVHVNVWEEEYEPSELSTEIVSQCGEFHSELDGKNLADPRIATMPIDELFSLENEVYVRELVEVDEDARPEFAHEAELDELNLTLLAQLAKLGISITVCDHYIAQDIYEFMWYVVLEEKTNPKLLEAGYVEHWMTHDYCDACRE